MPDSTAEGWRCAHGARLRQKFHKT
jgi:hypothetical protein